MPGPDWRNKTLIGASRKFSSSRHDSKSRAGARTLTQGAGRLTNDRNKTPLVVPRAVRRGAGFKSGQELEIKVCGGVIAILPKLPPADDEYTSQQRRAIDRGIAASEKDYKAGRSYGPFKTHEEFIASLHKEAASCAERKSNPQ
jgi:bifunctional DNA-binding transcriptional regulator/antitoxin component of YhaV-PrlF toxin-antitoxin module